MYSNKIAINLPDFDLHHLAGIGGNKVIKVKSTLPFYETYIISFHAVFQE